MRRQHDDLRDGGQGDHFMYVQDDDQMDVEPTPSNKPVSAAAAAPASPTRECAMSIPTSTEDKELLADLEKLSQSYDPLETDSKSEQENKFGFKIRVERLIRRKRMEIEQC